MKLKNIDAMARTLYGEARGESSKGQVAVAQVIVNRVNGKEWFGSTIYEVCHKGKQFSCWNTNDPNRAKLVNLDDGNATFLECIRIAAYVMAGDSFDLVHGATHYHTNKVSPPWSTGLTPCAEIGDHLFFNDVS